MINSNVELTKSVNETGLLYRHYKKSIENEIHQLLNNRLKLFK